MDGGSLRLRGRRRSRRPSSPRRFARRSTANASRARTRPQHRWFHRRRSRGARLRAATPPYRRRLRARRVHRRQLASRPRFPHRFLLAGRAACADCGEAGALERIAFGPLRSHGCDFAAEADGPRCRGEPTVRGRTRRANLVAGRRGSRFATDEPGACVEPQRTATEAAERRREPEVGGPSDGRELGAERREERALRRARGDPPFGDRRDPVDERGAPIPAASGPSEKTRAKGKRTSPRAAAVASADTSSSVGAAPRPATRWRPRACRASPRTVPASLSPRCGPNRSRREPRQRSERFRGQPCRLEVPAPIRPSAPPSDAAASGPAAHRAAFASKPARA